MSLGLLHQSFVTTPLSSSFKPNRNFSCNFVSATKISSRCCTPDDEEQSLSWKTENKMAKLALVALAAGVLTLSSVDPSSAAKTGARVGGQAFRSSAPRASAPRINNSRTNVYINPPVAPPLVGGYGFGFGVPFYGGWGWTPFSFFAPGPSVAIGVGGGFDILALFLFLGAATAVFRRFIGSRGQDDDYE